MPPPFPRAKHVSQSLALSTYVSVRPIAYMSKLGDHRVGVRRTRASWQTPKIKCELSDYCHWPIRSVWRGFTRPCRRQGNGSRRKCPEAWCRRPALTRAATVCSSKGLSHRTLERSATMAEETMTLLDGVRKGEEPAGDFLRDAVR